jgi:hypothetical protein
MIAPAFTVAAGRLGTEFQTWNASANFAAFVEAAIAHPPC